MSFAKLSSTIIDSSIWNADDHVIRVWIAFLAKKDENGFVEAAYSGMRRICNIKNDPDGKKFDHAISVLESPDPESKTKDFEGRRIQREDDGWIVLNHDKFRLRDDIVKDQTRDRVRKYREKNRNKILPPISPLPKTTDPETDTEGNALVTLRNVTPEEKVFEHWNSKKNLIHHRELTEPMESIIKDKLKEIPFDDMIKCIDNYDTVIGSPDSWYSYKNSIDDFFRPGKKKPAPCMKFIPERYVESNFIRPSKEKKEGGIVWKE
jgi:hypothetical protein